MNKIYNVYIYIKKWINTTNHKDIGILYLEKLNNLFNFLLNIWQIIRKHIIKHWNIIIIITWIILYVLGLLTIRRIITYTIIGIIIYGYKQIYEYILTDKCKGKMINVKKKEKLLYYLIRINNISLLTLIVNIEIKIYELIEWSQKYGYKTLNWIILLMSIIVPLKLVLSSIYTFFSNIQRHTMIEILWKRAFGLILSVLIFTNIIQVLLKIFETWIILVIVGYIYIVLRAWYDLQKRNQYELTYFKKSLNTYALELKRNNIILGIIKILWNDTKIDKVKFYEEYNKKFNVIMYRALGIENYKRKKLTLQLDYLNEIKGKGEWKNAKIEFFKNLVNIIVSNSWHGIFEELNDVSFVKAYLDIEEEKENISNLNFKEKHKKQTQYLSHYIYLQAQIVLYFIWEYIKLNKEIKDEDLYEMIVFEENDEYLMEHKELEFKIQEKFENVIEKQDYKKFKFLGNEEIYEEVYDITLHWTIVKKDKEYVMFDKASKNELYKNLYEFLYNDFETENGKKIPTGAIVSFTEGEILEKVEQELEKIKNKLIKEYKEKDMYKLLKEKEYSGLN